MKARTYQNALVFSLASLCVLCALCGKISAADLDTQAKEPYRLQVVLRVAPHRQLTPVFKEQLQRELGDSLQAAFGKVAEVSVSEDHPLLKDIETRGLQAVLDGFDKTADRKPGKTHFVLVDFIDGEYDIQAGQIDGLTGLTTPAVRHERTNDRQFVARTAARMVNQDFGVVGTVGKRLDGNKFEVTLKGSQLGVPFDRWAVPGEVFAIAQVSRAGTTDRAVRVEESFLQVVEAPKDGVCVCKLFNRYNTKEAKLGDDPNVLGYRCLKLGTSAEPLRLRLRLVDVQGLAQDGLQIEVSRYGFDKKEDFKYEGSTKDGVVQTEEKYPHLAFVRVLKQGTVIAQMPVPMVEGKTVVCRVTVNEQSGALGLLTVRKRTCVERMTEALLVQNDLREELGALMTKGKLAEAVQKTKEGLLGLDRDILDLLSEFNAISAEAQKIPNKPRFTLADGEQRLDELKAARADLQKHLTELEEAVSKWKNDTKRRDLEEKLLAARDLRRSARFDEAIKAYQEAIDKFGPNPGIQKELDQLRKDWEVKSDEHRQAREFVFNVWPKLKTPEKLRDRMGEARKSLAICKESGDKLTVQRLGMANVAHDGMLNKLLKSLRPEVEDDRRTAEVIEGVAGEMQKLHQDVLDYLKKDEKPAPKDEKR